MPALTFDEHEFRNIVDYCSEEVRRQGEWNPVHVAEMVDAWLYAIREKENGSALTTDLIEHIGRKVKPATNARGFRTIPIFITGRYRTEEKVKPAEILSRMLRWEENLLNMEPLEAYIEFEQIHPFADGNGRTGKIILNWLSDTLRAPYFPDKNIWGEPIDNP